MPALNPNTVAPNAVQTSALPPAAMSVPDAAGYLGLSVRLTWRLIAEGKLSRVKFGSRTVVRRAELDRLIAPAA